MVYTTCLLPRRLLDTINSLAKLFRSNQTLDVFGVDAESTALLVAMIEMKCAAFVVNPASNDADWVNQAKELFDRLTALSSKIQEGDTALAALPQGAATTSTAAGQRSLEGLRRKLADAKAVLDSLRPGDKATAFWTQVKGQIISKALDSRDRLYLDCKGQAIQVTKSRWYASDKLAAIGELQCVYRIVGADGVRKKSGVILKSSEPVRECFNWMDEVTWSRRYPTV